MTPYYSEGGIVILNMDCRDWLEDRQFHDPKFDLLLTDPPYGLGIAATGRVGGGKCAPVRDYGASEWDAVPAHAEIATARTITRWQIVFGGNYYHLPPTQCWLVWDKDNTGYFADCELAWTNLEQPVRKFTYRWNGMLQEPGCERTYREHPTQKPYELMTWCLTLFDSQTVFDPFMGSGTTLVACKRLGKSCLGIEREERYCEIAAKRLAQGVLPLHEPDPVAEQAGLW